MINKVKGLSLSVLSGLLLAFSWPTTGFTPIVFVSFIPVFFVFEISFKHIKWNSFFVFIVSFLCFLIFNGLTTGWISRVQPSGFFAVSIALFVNTTLMSLTTTLAFVCRKKYGINKGLRCFIVFWIMFEFLHLDWDLSWPWLTLGNVFSEKINWIQWYEYTGVLGGSFWILLINTLLFKCVLEYFNKKKKFNRLFVCVMVILIIPLLISKNLSKKIITTNDSITVAVVQPNEDTYKEKFFKPDIDHSIEILDLVDLTSNKVDYVLAPETALPDGMWEERIFDYNPIKLFNKYAQTFPQTHFVFGGLTFQKYLNNDNMPHTARESNGLWYDVFNSAIQVDSSDSIQIYHKSKLVAGSEMMPFVKHLGFMKKLFLDLGGTTGSLGLQKEREVFFSNNKMVKIAPVICYESIYGEYVADYIKKGANFIFILTNDAWWGNTQGHRQHASYAKLRAIETRRAIARSANTGVSCFINSKGEIINKIDWDKEGVITEKIHSNDKLTFYVKFGDYIGRIALFVGIFYLLQLIVFIRINIKKEY